ncbi:MAG: radical SAM protein [Candidatus Cloacimonadaceae bacterium]|nr:radical SAM protein [Candidatus Cloacimonadaceae bacterium]MDP3114913.1 radical SAM protein [Candidatus Cloacimonadaceae bacterium]
MDSRYWRDLKIGAQLLSKGVPIREILTVRLPFRMPDLANPPMLSVDVTDACDLSCLYCNNPLFPHPRTMMNDDVLASLLKQLERTKINRIRIGGGEPTLHPRLIYILKELSKRTRYLTVITNGQWRDESVAEHLILSGADLVEVSVDAGGEKNYEDSRPNASYPLLMKNLALLRFAKEKTKAKSILQIRLMLRPSTIHPKQEEIRFLGRFCDTVLSQRIMQHPESDYRKDVFVQSSLARNTIPLCSIPFKEFQVRPDGRVPMCPALGCSIYPEKQIFLGNISKDRIDDLWNCKTMRDIRAAHRSREGDILKTCLNCHYG